MHEVHALVCTSMYTAQHDVHTVDKAQYAIRAGSETGIRGSYSLHYYVVCMAWHAEFPVLLTYLVFFIFFILFILSTYS